MEYGDPVSKKATCTEDGYKNLQICKICGYKTYTRIPARHALRPVEGKAATCTESGWEDYEKCNNMGCDYSTYKQINALGHDHSILQFDETQHAYQCVRCDDVSKKGPHSGGKATCTEKAICETCGQPYGAEPAGHDFSFLQSNAVNHWFQCAYCEATVGKAAHRGGTATCTEKKICTVCNQPYGDEPLGHDLALQSDATQHWYQCASCNAITGRAAHSGGKATCMEQAVCKVCGMQYDDPSDDDASLHDLVHHAGKAATCTEPGWQPYDTCKRADCDYTTYAAPPALGHGYETVTVQPACTEKGCVLLVCSRCSDSNIDTMIPALGHWYGEWTPNGDNTHSAVCRREGCKHTGSMGCETVACRLLMTEAEDYVATVCPICGAVSDGVQLALAGEAAAKAERLPQGELVVRLGALQNGERMLSVAFEYAGKLTRPAEPVQITLPAALLEGYALHVLAADGTETALPVVVTGEDAAFTLRFDAQDEIPARLLRLVPAV
ncbi:MAG: hypothetical protein SOX25_09860 [Eubacteriales bacterium]|nr:hypothetical protein [Eubacteriales bacterium]